ncbi:MAG: hypothetical protein V3V78_05335, partial [Candidatus Woesearchaeota archaeon]
MKTSMKLITVFMIQILIAMPIALSQDDNGTVSGSVINVELPEYSNQARIDVSGTTEPNTRIRLILNGAPIRNFIGSPDGIFSFPSVDLDTLSPNILKFEATDAAGGFVERTFTVTVDLDDPVINLVLPAATGYTTFGLTGTVSEESFVEIYNNEDLKYGDTVTAIAYNMTLT